MNNSMKLLYGLGNPDEENTHSRHNAGWMALDGFRNQTGATRDWTIDPSGEFIFSLLDSDGVQAALCKPTRYMNDQGVCLTNALARFNINPSTDLLVLHDDLDLPLGKMRLRQRGSPPSHNGLSSIREQLRTDIFWRLRLGIDSRKSRTEMPGEEFVLNDFSPQEMSVMEEVCARAVSVIRQFISGHVQEAVAYAKK